MEEHLLFVIAAPRSGSTLLARMLGAHSRVHAPAELHLLTPLAHLGFQLDAASNEAHGASSGGLIVTNGPPFALVVPTDEESLIALETERVLESSA